jgi:hypothetical protein
MIVLQIPVPDQVTPSKLLDGVTDVEHLPWGLHGTSIGNSGQICRNCVKLPFSFPERFLGKLSVRDVANDAGYKVRLAQVPGKRPGDAMKPTNLSVVAQAPEDNVPGLASFIALAQAVPKSFLIRRMDGRRRLSHARNRLNIKDSTGSSVPSYELGLHIRLKSSKTSSFQRGNKKLAR